MSGSSLNQPTSQGGTGHEVANNEHRGDSDAIKRIAIAGVVSASAVAFSLPLTAILILRYGHPVSDAVIGIGGLMTAFAGGVAAYFGGMLWRSTDKLWEAGENQRRDLERGRQQELRAYVFLDTINPDTTKSLDMLTEYAIRIMNSGKTPAFDVTVRSAIGIGPPESERRIVVRFPEDPHLSQSPLPPGGIVTHTQAAHRWEPSDARRLDAGEVVYLVGRIDYVDAFGRNQWTTFQHVRAPGSHELHACAKGNDAKRG